MTFRHLGNLDRHAASWRVRGRRIGAAAFAFTARSLQQVTTFVLTLLAARYLLPAEYGVYTLSVVFVTFIQTLTYTGYFHYAVRAKGEEREVLDTCFWLILAFSIIGSAALYLGAPTIAGWFDAPDLAVVLRILAAIQPIAATTAWSSSVLMRQKQMNLHFTILTAQNLIALISGVFLLILWPSVFALVAHRVVRTVSGVLLYLLLTKVRPGISIRWMIVRDATQYSLALYGTRMMNFVSNYGADLALGLIYSTSEAGLYRFGARIATGAIDIVTQPLNSFALSLLGAAHRHNQPLGPVVERLVPTIFMLVGIVAGTILVFGRDVVTLLFQQGYLDALVVTYALSVAALLGLGNSLVEPVLAAAGRTGASLRHHAVWTTLLTASIPLTAQFGLGALAWSRAGIWLVAGCAGFRLMSRETDVELKPVVRAIARAAVCVLAYVLLILMARMAVATSAGIGRAELATGLALAGFIGLGMLVVAANWRVLHLRVFSD